VSAPEAYSTDKEANYSGQSCNATWYCPYDKTGHRKAKRKETTKEERQPSTNEKSNTFIPIHGMLHGGKQLVIKAKSPFL
jgi:uncharacterized surface anchored protein